MLKSTLIETSRTLLLGGKGLLAMDESTGTCDKRFAKAGIPQTEEARRAYRELLVCTPGLNAHISGAILFDETIRQKTTAGKPFVDVLRDAGIVPGIKVDMGAKPLAGHAGELITEGLDGLRERLDEYREMGARFAKWRGVISPSLRACPAAPASKRTRTPSPATQRCARRRGWCPSSNRKC